MILDHDKEPQGRKRAIRIVANYRAAPPPEPLTIMVDRETLSALTAMGGALYSVRGYRMVRKTADHGWVSVDYAELTGQESKPIACATQARRARQSEIDLALGTGRESARLPLDDTL